MDKQVTPIRKSRQKLPPLLLKILHHDSELRFKIVLSINLKKQTNF